MLHPADDTTCQADFDSMGMRSGLCENILNYPFRQLPRALILFLDHLNL